MDDDACLMRQPSTGAGMIMEDASAAAIVVGGKRSAVLPLIIDDLQIQAIRITALLAAAKAVLA